MRLTTSLLLLGWLNFIRAAEPAAPHSLRVDATGFDAQESDILAICKSVASELQKYSPDLPRENIVIVRETKDSPITLFKRNEKHEIVVKLNTHETYWAQYSYQFAHELCHVHCGFRPGPNDNLWFEETVCETSSLFCLRAMSRTWQNEAPFPNWKSFAPKLNNYADDTMRKRTYRQELQQIGSIAFYQKHEKELRADPTNRELNGAIALFLLSYLEERPERWAAFQWLNATEKPAKESFKDYLKRWENNTPAAHQETVQGVRKLFGIP